MAVVAVILAFMCSLQVATAAVPGVTVELMGRKFTAYKTAKKESLYAFSVSQGLNYDTLSMWNRGIGSEIPKGYILYLPQGVVSQQPPAVKAEKIITYRVKHGDTLYSIARRYNTTVEDIIAQNPRLRSSILPQDIDIRVKENSAQRSVQELRQMQRGIVAFQFHEVKKDESPEGLAASNGITQQLLAECNPGVSIKRKAAVAIPVIGEVPVIVYARHEDSRETTVEGQQSIFDSIANLNHVEGLDVCVLMSTPQTNKDVDFARGLLTAVKEFGEGSRHINISFVNASTDINTLLSDPAVENASLIFTTYDSSIPDALAEYAGNNGKTLVNAFAVRDTLYRTNPAVINLLSSPEEFNAQVADYISENFNTSYIVFIGNPLTANDQIANKVMNVMDTENFDVVESLENIFPHPSRPMVFYSMANGKKEIKEDLDKISAWMTTHPEVDVNTIGRPSWIVYVDTYGENLRNTHANVPTRFYFPDKDSAPQQFLKIYHEFFKADPVRSYPAYSVMGYDAAWYFMRPGAQHEFLQMPFRLTRMPGGGEYNSAAFMLRFFPGLPVTKFDIIPYEEIQNGNAR